MDLSSGVGGAARLRHLALILCGSWTRCRSGITGQITGELVPTELNASWIARVFDLAGETSMNVTCTPQSLAD